MRRGDLHPENQNQADQVTVSWTIEAYLGHMQRGKSTAAFKRLQELGGGYFITNRRIPAVIQENRPPFIQDNPATLARLEYYLERYRKNLCIKVTQGGILRVIRGLRGMTNINVVFDDAYLVMAQLGKGYAEGMNRLDAYLGECGHNHVNAIITTHRIKKNLSPFVRENANRIYWVGPCQSEDEMDDLLANSVNGMTKAQNQHALTNNAWGHPFMIRG